MSTPAFPPILGTEDGDLLFCGFAQRDVRRAEVVLRVRRGPNVLQGILDQGAWHLAPSDVGPQGLAGLQHVATVHHREARPRLQFTGAVLFPLPMSSTQQPARGGEVAPRRGERVHVQMRGRAPARDDMRRATPADREEVRNLQRQLRQPPQELGWRERVAAVGSIKEAAALLGDLHTRCIGTVVVEVEDWLADHLIEGIRGLRTDEQLQGVGGVVPMFATQQAMRRVLEALGKRTAELQDAGALRVERDPPYQGGEERLGDGCE